MHDSGRLDARQPGIQTTVLVREPLVVDAEQVENGRLEVTDWGVGIWSMHSTYDVASKADIWALFKGFVVFFQS